MRIILIAALAALCTASCIPRPAAPAVRAPNASPGSGASDPDAIPRAGAIDVRDAAGVTRTYRTSTVSGEHIGQSTPTDTGGDTASVTSGALHVGDGTGPLTVDGTVTVTDGSGALNVIVDSGSVTASISGGATETTLADIETDVDTLIARTPALGQAAMAASTPVVIASNQSTLLVGDGSGPLSVDGTVNVTDGVGSLTIDGNVGISSIAPGTANIGDVDVASLVPGTSATNLGKEPNTAFGLGHTGVLHLGVVGNTGANVTTAGNYAPYNLTTAGALRVGGNAAGDLGKVEDVAHADGDVGVPALCVRKDTVSTGIGVNGDYVPCATDASGNLHVNINAVASSGTFGLTKAEDAVAGDQSVLVGMGAVRSDTPAATNADGDWTWLKTDDVGRLHVRPVAGFIETTALSAVTSSSDQDSAVIDLRGYSHVRIDYVFDPATSVTGNIYVFGAATSSSIFTLGQAMDVDSVVNGACDAQTASSWEIPVDYAFGEGGVPTCVITITNPPPYIGLRWDRVTGGGASGLTARVFARAR